MDVEKPGWVEQMAPLRQMEILKEQIPLMSKKELLELEIALSELHFRFGLK